MLSKIIIAGKELKAKLFHTKIPNRIKKTIPYFAQWESSELVDDILSGKMKAQNDPLWKKSGARTTSEYVVWSWSGCGMACLKMILADKMGKVFPLVSLGKQCMRYGGYRDNSSQYNTEELILSGKRIPPDYFEGLLYEPFLKFIRDEFGLHGEINKYMTITDIINALQKKYVMVSVNASIRDATSKPIVKGGHLVLVTGYDTEKKLLYIHNPSGYYKKSQEHFPISFLEFETYFAHRGIVIL